MAGAGSGWPPVVPLGVVGVVEVPDAAVPGVVARSATAPGFSSISGLRSSTSKTRSKLTSAVITSTWTLDSAVIGP